MSLEAYKIAVKLNLVNNVSSGLVAMAGQFQALNRHIGSTQAGLSQIEKQLGAIKRLGLVGGAMTAAGGFGLSLFRAPLEEAAAFQQEMARFRALGVGDAVSKDAEKFAKGMNNYGTSMRDNLVLLRDAQTILGDYEHAKVVAPMLAQMKFANAAMYGEEGGAMKDRAFMDMLKVVELRKGLSSEEAFRKQANMIQQVQTATGGRVGGSEYLQLIKTGGVAAKSISDDVFYYKLEPLIQEMGGMRVGTGLMSAYQNLMLGRTSVQVAKELQRLGLLDPRHIEYNGIGMIKRILPGGLKGGETLASDPIEFLEKVLLPSFAKKGITSEKDILQELGLIFSNRTASQLFSTMFLQMGSIKKNEALNRGSMNIEQLAAEAQKTPAGQMLELQKKWRDVLNELGTTVLPIAIKAVEGLTSVVKGVIGFAKEFPVLTKGLAIGFGILSGLVAAGGVLMLTTAAFKALGLALQLGAGGTIASAIISTTTALAGLALPIVALAGAAAIGYKFATWLGADKLGSWLGGKLADLMLPDPMEKPITPQTVKPSASSNQLKNGDIYMDGRRVGQIVTAHQAREASRPAAGATAFDLTFMPPPNPMGYAR